MANETAAVLLRRASTRLRTQYAGSLDLLAALLDRLAVDEEYHLAEFGHRTVPAEATALARQILGEA